MAALVLKPGREKSLLRRHPWIFSGAVEHVEGGPQAGETVDLMSTAGQFLARAAYSPQSQIRARVWTFRDEPIEPAFFRRRIRGALEVRARIEASSASPASDPESRRGAAAADGARLIYAESDGLPGIIVDRYADMLIMQCLTAGADGWRETLADLLLVETGIKTIFERSEADVRQLEGLPPRAGILRDSGSASSPDPRSFGVVISECGLKFQVDVAHGHKTGFYLDQRLNRQRLRELAHDRQVLDCFCYTGGFALNALVGGASSVLALDSSASAISLARHNLALNNLPADLVEFQEADVFARLRKLRDEARTFDLIVLDPPRFAPTAAHAEKAARAYKDINLLAFKLLRPGGTLVTFSCSGGIDAALFQKIVASAALDAGVDAQILEHLSQSPDHPIALNFPESAYLKGLVIVKQSASQA